jgi:TolB-like protein
MRAVVFIVFGLFTPAAFAQSTAKLEKPKLVVLELSAAGGVEAQVASAVTEAVTAEVAGRGFFDVVSAKDIQTLLGVERQRQMLGCSDEGATCLTELAGAMGARFVLSGSLARLGDTFQLTLQTLDSAKAQPIGRATRLAKDLSALREGLPFAVAEATATPLPPPPSRILPYSVMGAGALTFVAGGLLMFDAVSRERAINRELENGEQNPGALKPLSSYQDEARGLVTQKGISIAALLVGAGAMGLGLYLNPKAASGGSAVAFTVGPTTQGLFAGGTF